MGVLYSRQDGEVENFNMSFMSYRYPAKSGNYFSSHFIMGDQMFTGTQPECFLFGDNSDLNFLPSKPASFPYPEPSKSEPTKMLRSLLNLRKDSLRLVKHVSESTGKEDEGSTPTYYIDFTFDADVKCSVTIHYLAFEDLSSGHAVYKTNDSLLTSRAFEFDKGPKQTFCKHGKLHLIKPSDFKESELIYSETSNHIPVVIHITATEDEYAGHSNITLANIEKLSDGTFTIKLLKQKQMVDGLCYLLHDIYGLESKYEMNENKSTDVCDVDYDEYADENVVCVVCMSDTRDTLMLPCRHLCVCSDCASSLRSGSNFCPICRVPFHALLQLCAYQRTNVNSKSHSPYHGYEKVDLFDALNAFSFGKRESAREIVRRVSARAAKSRSRPATPKPSHFTTTNSEKTLRRSSSRFSRGSRGSYKHERTDVTSEPSDSTSRSSIRSSSQSSTRVGSSKSHVVEVEESVDDGVEVGQDNLGMDRLEDEHRATQESEDEIPEIDVTTTHVVSPSPYELSSPTIPGHDGPPSIHAFPMNVATNFTIRLPGTPLDKDIACSAGAESESRSEASSDDFQKKETFIV